MNEIVIYGVKDLTETEIAEVNALTGVALTLSKFREDYKDKSGTETVDDIVEFISAMLEHNYGIVNFGAGGINEIS